MLIGDGDNERVWLVFGSPLPLGRDVLLDNPVSARRTAIIAPEGEVIGEWMAAAGDVNGDEYDDMLIGTTGSSGKTYLLLGQATPWWETVKLHVQAAATIDTSTDGARLSSAGDMDGDFYDEFAVADGSTVYLFEGKGSFSEGNLAVLPLGNAVDSFDSVDTAEMAALGDVNGDEYDDFIYAADDGTARVVFGDSNLDATWDEHDFGYDADFVAAPGNVDDPDEDGYNDILIGEGDDVYLIKGNSGTDPGSIDATLSGVADVASALYAAGADLNSDGSSDLLLVATESAADDAGYASPLGRAARINPAWLPHAPGASAVSKTALHSLPQAVLATCYVNDDGGADHTTIQLAVNDAGCDEIVVQPGVYAPFIVNGKDNLTIRGVDPDAVFVDAGGSGFAVHITGADGVQVISMTLRNASYGVQLTDAGVGGHDVMNKRTILDHLLIYDVSYHDVDMSRTSSVSITRSTLVRSSNHIGTFGAADPNIVVEWDAVIDAPFSTYDGGGITAIGDRIYFEMGNGQSAFRGYDAATNQLLFVPWGPNNVYQPNSAIAAGNDEQIYLIGAPSWKDASYSGVGIFDKFAEGGNGVIYTEYASGSNGPRRWNGVGWSEISGLSSFLDCHTFAAHPVNGDLYCLEYGVDTMDVWDGSDWTEVWNDPGHVFADNSIHDVAVDSEGNVHVVGDFSIDSGFDTCYSYAKFSGSSWSCWGDFDSDDEVNVIAINPDGNTVYVGGDFTTDYARNITTMSGGSINGVSGGPVNAIEVGNDGTVYVGGEFTATLNSGGGVDQTTDSGIVAWNGYSWSTYPEVLPEGTAFGHQYSPWSLAETDGGELYAVGWWQQYVDGGSNDVETEFIRWDGAAWEILGTSGNATNNSVMRGIGATGQGVFINGDFDWIDRPGGSFTVNNLLALQFSHEVYSPTANAWTSNLIGAPMSLGDGASYAGDDSGYLYLIPGGGSKHSFRYNIATGKWHNAGDLPVAVTGSAMTQGSSGDMYAIVNGGGFYSNGSSSWSSVGGTISEGTMGAIDDGASLTYDPKRNAYYAFPGGNSTNMLRYQGGSWELLPVGRSAPAGIKPGAGLVYVPGEEENALFATEGNYTGSSKAFWRYPLPEPNKVGFEYSAIVVPTGSPANWLDLSDPLPEDFNIGIGPGNTWFNGTGEPNNDGASLPTSTADPFLDSSHDVYRMKQSGYDLGYHTYRATAYVDASGGAEFSTIQAAIDSRTNRVIVKPGVYDPFYLTTGVEVIGANGADWTVIEADGSADPLVRAEGPVGASLARFTLDGVDKSVNGLEVDGNANVKFERGLVYDTDTGILIDGAGSDLEVVNATVAHNTNGLQATNDASVDVRNTIFAYNTGAGLSYDSGAASTLHTYNLFWANGADFGGDADAGAAELFLDPLFVDGADHNYHTLGWSPVIDAGDPGDPAPPSAGNRVDIGYVEQGRANYYVDDAYCEICDNDGLTWQTDAFDNIQDALDHAAEDLMLLNVSAEEAPQLAVGVSEGTYNERVTVPSHVHLLGNGAEETTIDGGSGGAVVTFDGATNAKVSDLTITGAGSPGVAVKGASNEITITRNIIRGNPTGVAFSERATGRVTFNAIVDNTVAGVSSSDAGSWANVNSNILAGNGTGLSASSNGQIFGDYNLLDNTTNYDGVPQGDHDVVGEDPQFQGGTYRITADSPALDAASTRADVPEGGGERADMGYRELLAAPLSIFLGQQDLSTAVGNSGVDEVEYSVVPIDDTSEPVTATLPTIWETATISPGMQGETVAYWETVYTPTQESVHRFYSRATDEMDNQEEDEEDWYEGSFVADSTSPTVAWLSSPSGNVNRPLELRAEVEDYAAGEFSIEEKDVEFEIDGTIYPAEWAAESWDEENEAPRVFRAWVSPTLAAHVAYAVAEDKAGNSTKSGSINFTVNGTSPADTVSPTLTVAWPSDGGWVTHTVVFSGTANDGGSGIASVEVSLDGGYLWMPATVDGTNWSLTWEGPEWQEFVSYPGRVRASDQAGNITTTERVFSMDEIPPMGLAPVTFSSPEGTHFDISTTLAITWNTPVDGSGVVTTLLAVDQFTDTIPTTPVVGTTAIRELDANGEWYVHLRAIDAAGNQIINHYGLWHVGITDAGTGFWDRRQSIVVDGYLDVENGEWRTDEFLDNDVRTIGSQVTYSPQGTQAFHTTWDGGDFYLAWQGAWWDLDGTLWIYLDAGAGGSNELVSKPPDTGLPFDADYAVEITSPISGTLWQYDVSGWITSTEEWEFAQGQSGDTEIRLPLFDTDDIGVLAFAVGDDGLVYAVFPTVNSLNPPAGAPPAMMRAAARHLAARGARSASLSISSAWVSYQWEDEVPPTGLDPVTFSPPEGTHFDAPTPLTITWNTPVDGSGVVTTLLAVDQVSDTTPTAPVGGNSATEDLDASGDWYVHLAARDAAGNQSIRHYGPWHVGTFADAGVPFENRQQSIIVDGYLDMEHGEWRADLEYLDDDERAQDNLSFYTPREGQSFYTTWDGDGFYLAWQGAWWEIDGTLWVYLDAEPGGSNQLISSSPDTSLPFDADYAVEITSPTEGALWEYTWSWQPSAEDWEFAQGESGGTEVRLPLFGTLDVQVIAFALGDDDMVYAIFPTVNALNPTVEAPPMMQAARHHLAAGRIHPTSLAAASPWVSYQWDDIKLITDPNAGQPTATSVELTLDSLQAPATSWGPSSTLTYVVKLENLESYTVADLQLSFTALPTSALEFVSVDGADCVTCMVNSPWWFETDLPTETVYISITGHLTGDLSSLSVLTTLVALESISTTPEIAVQGVLNHQIDGQPPTVTVTSDLLLRPGSRTIQGTASDGDGVGVAVVEVRPEGGGWQEADGTLSWSADVTVPAQPTWQLEVRAKDEYSQTSAIVAVTFTVDALPPTVTLNLPPALGGGFTEITGTASDLPSEGQVFTVEVQLDDDTAPWQSAILYAPDDAGVHDWLWLLGLPAGVEGDTHKLRARAGDLAGNVSAPSAWQEVVVDTVAPVIIVTKLITLTSGPTAVLSGTISDGTMDGITVTVHVNTPQGNSYSAGAVYSEGSYSYVLDPGEECGDFIVYVEGIDLAGNSVKQGPFKFIVPCPVGGTTVPLSVFDLLLPWMRLAALVGLLLAGAVVFVKKRKH